jgi:hypothetical protein
VIWVLIFGGIALCGLIMVIGYAVWLFHKASDVMSEVRVLLNRGEQLGAILGEIELPQMVAPSGEFDSRRTFDAEFADELRT